MDTDLEEVGHGLENHRNTAPHQGSKGPKTKQNEQSKFDRASTSSTTHQVPYIDLGRECRPVL